MNLEKALKILGLNRNFTESDLKKAYRRLIIKWHPDLCKDVKLATEKTQELNLARDYLVEFLKVDKFSTSTSYRSNNYYSNTTKTHVSRNKILELYNNLSNTFIKKIYNTTPDEDAVIAMLNIRRMINAFAYETSKYNDDNIDVVINIYSTYKEKINNEIIKYIHTYCDKRELKYKDGKKMYGSSLKITIEDDYIIDTYDDVFSISEKLSKIKKKNRNELLIEEYANTLTQRYLEDVIINYNYDNVTNKYIVSISEYIKSFKVEAKLANDIIEIDSIYTKFNNLIKSMIHYYALEYCNRNYIPTGESTLDYIVVYGIRIEYKGGILAVKRTIDLAKSYDEFIKEINKNNIIDDVKMKLNLKKK